MARPDRALEERRLEALRAAESRFPQAERVTIHTYYGGDFYAAVKMPGESFWRVGVADPGAED